MTEAAGAANLRKIEHIVVLMMENRSFDHMLGYLSLEAGRGDVDGLRAEYANEHEGHRYPVHHLGTTAIADDPDHSADAVDLQVGGGAMDGFVASFAKTLSDRGVRDADPSAIMGYYTAADVPVYDHLAREFAVCDRWFSSVPGRPGPTGCMRCAAGPPAAAMTGRPTCRPFMTSRRSCGIWTRRRAVICWP
jgi:phospholipase C